MNIVLVHLVLMHPNPSDESSANGLTVDLCFDAQPTPRDVYEAYCEVPTVNRHPDFHIYRARLNACLETYGVPQLGKFSAVTPEGAPIEASMLYATWHLNLVASTGAALGVRVGDIRVSQRRVHQVAPAVHDPEPDPLRDTEHEVTSNGTMTAIRKNRLEPVRKAKPRKSKSTKP